MKTIRRHPMLKGAALLLLLGSPLATQAQEADAFYPLAVTQFQERGRGVAGYGEKVQDLLFASLATDPRLLLVDRTELKQVLDEAELTLSGMVSPGAAIQVGQLTGAKILVSGSVIETGDTLVLIARIIGTETSRVLAQSVKGCMRDKLDVLVDSLGERVIETIVERSGELVAPVRTRENLVAEMNRTLGDRKRPSVQVRITEMHVGRPIPDPAAETELMLILKETGFEVLDGAGRATGADLIISGEGFSELATRRGSLISVKARLEVKATGRSGDQVIAVDRQTSVAVDLAEHIAGKSALQQAAATLAERLIPKLVLE